DSTSPEELAGCCPFLSCAGRSASKTRVNALVPAHPSSCEEGSIAGSGPAMTNTIHAAFGSAALLSAKAHTDHSGGLSTSGRATVEPHQMRKPGGASRYASMS